MKRNSTQTILGIQIYKLLEQVSRNNNYLRKKLHEFVFGLERRGVSYVRFIKNKILSPSDNSKKNNNYKKKLKFCQ